MATLPARPATPPREDCVVLPDVDPLYGWLEKKGSRFPRSWKRRWFTLVDGHAGYFVDEDCRALKGEFSVGSDSVVEEVKGTGSKPFAFVVKSSGLKHKKGNLLLCAASEDEKTTWMAAFRAHAAFIERREKLDVEKVDFGSVGM